MHRSNNTRRDFLKALGWSSAAIGVLGCRGLLEPLSSGQAGDRPNVILIVTDDQGYGDIGAHGNPVLKTPNLDILHAQSLRLDNYHVDPVCSPTRAALMTGRYASRTGVWAVTEGRQLLRRDEITVADVFAHNGYRTGIFGKWHLGDNYPYSPRYRGFQEVVTLGGGAIGEIPDFWGNDYFDDTYLHNGKLETYRGYCTDVFFGEALKFIRSNKSPPFFVYLPINAMHGPHKVADEYAEPYRSKGIPENRARFYGMIANFDENLGRLLTKLKQWDLEDNTIVIFMGDNGTSVDYNPKTGDGYNAGMRAKKGSVYDGGHRVACFIRWPGKLQAGHEVRPITSHRDILPTLIELCDLKKPEGVKFDGDNIVPLLTCNAPRWPERTMFVHRQPDHPKKWNECAVMTDRWRLVNGEELYDMSNDPGQKTNVAALHPELVKKLREAYEKWWADISDRFDEYCHFLIGSENENPTVLTARDWHPTQGRVPWRQQTLSDDKRWDNGFWAVEIVQSGQYEFTLRRFPTEANKPMSAMEARLKIANIDVNKSIPKKATSITFRLALEARHTQLQTWLSDEKTGKIRGAYYVYVKRFTGKDVLK